MSVLARWDEIWIELGLKPEPELHAELRHCYSESHRAYHTLHHIRECLELLEGLRERAERPAELELAIWFHDALYDVRRSDNEVRSAEWARNVLRRAGAPQAQAQRVHDLVLVTRHNAEVGEGDAQLLSDIDLAILGAGPARFDEYEKQVRREYHHVPKVLFNPARRKILREFLARPRIYLTKPMFEAREAAARSNLERSLRQLAWWRF